MKILKTLKTGIESLMISTILIITTMVLAIISGGEYTWYLFIPIILISIQALYWIGYGLIVVIKKWLY